MLYSAYDLGRLADTQRYGLLTLACKDDSNADQLTSWRPISLINADYKIPSKFLPLRLGNVLEDCIHKDEG